MLFKHTPVSYVELESEIVSGQRWYHTPEGNRYPSVTTILGDVEKPWLDSWKMALGAKKAQQEIKRCTERGNAVHLMAEQYLKNKDVDAVIKGHDSDHVKLFNKLKLTLNKINNIIAQEIPLYSDTLKMAGRCDCIAEYDGVLSIIDFKTANNNKSDIMVEDYKLQTTAYSLMFGEMFNIHIDQIVILISVEKGLMPLVFKSDIENHVTSLVERINMFNKNLKQ